MERRTGPKVNLSLHQWHRKVHSLTLVHEGKTLGEGLVVKLSSERLGSLEFRLNTLCLVMLEKVIAFLTVEVFILFYLFDY